MNALWECLEDTLGKGFDRSSRIQSEIIQLSRTFTEERSSRLQPDYFSAKGMREAYLAYFLPLNFQKVLELLKTAPPATFDFFHPQYICDFGSGPGTAALAALAFFAEKTPEAHRSTPICVDLIDAQINTFDVAKPLIERFARKLNLNVRIRCFKDIEVARKDLPEGSQYTLSLAINVLNELPPDVETSKEPLLSLWRATRGAMLVVEPSHRVSSQRLVRFRERLLAKIKGEGTPLDLIGPCTHREACPVNRTKHWCHFSEPTPDRRLISLSLNTFRDPRLWLKFSYLYLRKTVPKPAHDALFRAIGDLHPSSGKWAIDLCQPKVKRSYVIPAKLPPHALMGKLVRGALVEIGHYGKIIAKPLTPTQRIKPRAEGRGGFEVKPRVRPTRKQR